MINNIVFDMDGTLADTAKATVIAFSKFAPQFGLGKLADETIKAAIGYANPEFYFRLYPQSDMEMLIKFGEQVEKHEKLIIRELGENILFDGVKDLLQILSADGFALHLASTGNSKHVAAVLGDSGIKAYFKSVSCGEAEKTAMVRNIIQGSELSQWMMVGDKQKDSDAAHGNNILSVGAGYGYLLPEDYRLFDAVIQTPSGLLDFLKGDGFKKRLNTAEQALGGPA
jgi:phosphoglycolate phosphatase